MATGSDTHPHTGHTRPHNMILVLGLLTLLAVAHTDAGHIKGRPHVDWTQEKLHQDDIPSPQISVAPAQDAAEGWIHDPRDALEDHARIKTVSRGGAIVDALHDASGEHHGKAQTAPTQVKTIVKQATTDSAANNPAAVKTILKKTQVFNQGVNNPTTTIVSRQSVPVTRSQYKVKTVQRTSTPVVDSDSVLKFVPGSPGSPVLIPGQLSIPQEIGPLGLGPYSAEFGQRTRVITSGPGSEFSIDTSKPSAVSNQPLTRARGEAQRQAAVTTAQRLDLPAPSLTASSPEEQPLVYAPPSADLTPEMIAAIEGEIGGRIVTGSVPGADVSVGDVPLSRIPTELLDASLDNLPEPKLKIDKPTVQTVDYRKDSVILRPQTQESSGITPAANIQPYTGAGRIIYKPPIVKSPVRSSVPVRKPAVYETLRRTPIPSVVPSRASFDAPLSPLGENVPISGVDGNVFGRVGQIFEMSPGGKLTPVSGSKPATDKYVQTLKEKIQYGNQRTQTVVSSARKPDASPQITLTPGGIPKQSLDNVPISGLDNVQGHVGQIFEISADGKVVPVSESPASVQPAAVVTSPRQPTEVKQTPQPPLSVASLPRPQKPQAAPISRSSSVVPPKAPTQSLSAGFGSRTSPYLPLNILQRTGPEFPNVLGGYQTFSGIQGVGFGGIPGGGLRGIQTTSFPGIEDALTEGIISNELLAQIPAGGLTIPQGLENVIPFGTIPSPIQPIPGFVSNRRPTQILSTGASPFQGTLQEIVAPGSIPQGALPFQITSFDNRVPQNLPLPLQIPFGRRPQATIPGRSPQVIVDRTVQAPRRGPQATSGRTDLRSSPRTTPQIPTQLGTPQKPSTTLQKPSMSRTTPQRPLPPSRISQTQSSTGASPAPPAIRRTPQVPPTSSGAPQIQTTPGRIPQTPTPLSRTGAQRPVSIQRTTSQQLPPFRETISRIEQSVFQGAPQGTTGGLGGDFSLDKVPISGVDGNIFGHVGQIFEMSSDGKLVPASGSQALTDKPKPPPSSRQIITSTGTRISQPSPQAAPGPQITRTIIQSPRPAIPTVKRTQTRTNIGQVDFAPDRVPISGVDGNIYGQVGQIFEMSSDGKLIPASDSQSLPEVPKPAPPSRRIITTTGTRVSQPQIAPRPQISRTVIQSPKPAIFTSQRTGTRTNIGQIVPTAGATRSGTAPGNIQALVSGMNSQTSTGPQTIRNEEQIQLHIDEEIRDPLLKPVQLDPTVQMTGPKSTFHRIEEVSPQVISVSQGDLRDDLQQQLVQSSGFSQVPQQSASASQIPLLTRVDQTPNSQEQVLEQVLL